jgi:hypothetical protein
MGHCWRQFAEARLTGRAQASQAVTHLAVYPVPPRVRVWTRIYTRSWRVCRSVDPNPMPAGRVFGETPTC